MNKCCSDKVKHNLLEAFEHDPPIHLYCGGTYSWQEESVYVKLLDFMPEDFVREYLFYEYADNIMEYANEAGIDEAEAMQEARD